MGKKKTKLSDEISLSDGLPDDIRTRIAIPRRRLLEKYNRQEIEAFVDDYRQHYRNLGLSFGKVPLGRSTIPSEAFSHVANLSKALDDAKRVLRSGIGVYLGPGAEQLYGSEQQKRKAEKKGGTLGPVRQAVALSNARDFSQLLAWFKDEGKMSDLWEANKIHIQPDDPDTFDDATDLNGEMSYSNRAGDRKRISYKSLKQYHTDYLKLKQRR